MFYAKNIFLIYFSLILTCNITVFEGNGKFILAVFNS